MCSDFIETVIKFSLHTDGYFSQIIWLGVLDAQFIAAIDRDLRNLRGNMK